LLPSESEVQKRTTPDLDFRRLFRALLVVATVIAVVVIPPVRSTFTRGLILLLTGHLRQFQEYLHALGLWGPIVSIILMIAASIAIPVPVTVLMIANGLVFGIWTGMLVSFAGGFGGAVATYIIGHQLGRDAVSHLLSVSSLEAADRAMHRRGGWAIVIGRWIPGIPCDPISYVAGITRMPVVRFLLLTIAGLLPANLATAFVGAEAATDVQLQYWIFGVAIGIGVLFVWAVIHRHRKRRLMEQADAP
jgi:uncharacterized membrane protein YdjX (TVP38/TMEM64 family)